MTKISLSIGYAMGEDCLVFEGFDFKGCSFVFLHVFVHLLFKIGRFRRGFAAAFSFARFDCRRLRFEPDDFSVQFINLSSSGCVLRGSEIGSFWVPLVSVVPPRHTQLS